MAKIFQTSADNKLVVWISGIVLFSAILLFIVYPPLQFASGIYGLLALVSLTFYTNPAFQDDLIGMPKRGLLKSIFIIGPLLGIGFLILPKIIPGLSMGIPLLPASVQSNLQWLVICLWAPLIEEIATRGALLGFVKYLGRRGKSPSTLVLWIAIITQAVFFMALHALAYSAGWYSAPTWLGALGNFSAVSASLIAAGLFGLIMGIVVTRKWTNTLAVSIIAHYAVNQILFNKFTKFVVIGIIQVLI